MIAAVAGRARTTGCCASARATAAGPALSFATVVRRSALVGGGEPALALVDDHRGRELAARELLDGLERLDGLRVAGQQRRRLVLLRALELARLAPPRRRDDDRQTTRTTHFARRPAGRVRRRAIVADPTESRSRWPASSAPVPPGRDRQPAGEVLADVGGGAAVDRRRGPPAAARVAARRPPAPRAGGTRRARRARAAPTSSAASATSRTGARWKSIARSRWPNASGCCGAIVCSSAHQRQRRVLVARLAGQRGQAQQAEARRPSAPHGIGASSRSLRRAISRRGRRRWRRSRRARGRRSARGSSSASSAPREPARVERRLVQREKRLEQVRVVLQERRELRLPAVEGAQQAAAASRSRAR